MCGFYITIMLHIFQNPLFRHVVLFLAITLLMVFCIDKSRQNRRTRNALYNCVYVLYAGAILKLLQIVDLMLPLNFILCQAIGLLLAVVAAVVYWRWLKPQADIPYNKIFYWVGWGVLACTFLMQAAFLCLSIFHGKEV